MACRLFIHARVIPAICKVDREKYLVQIFELQVYIMDRKYQTFIVD